MTFAPHLKKVCSCLPDLCGCFRRFLRNVFCRSFEVQKSTYFWLYINLGNLALESSRFEHHFDSWNSRGWQDFNDTDVTEASCNITGSCIVTSVLDLPDVMVEDLPEALREGSFTCTKRIWKGIKVVINRKGMVWANHQSEGNAWYFDFPKLRWFVSGSSLIAGHPFAIHATWPSWPLEEIFNAKVSLQNAEVDESGEKTLCTDQVAKACFHHLEMTTLPVIGVIRK